MREQRQRAATSGNRGVRAPHAHPHKPPLPRACPGPVVAVYTAPATVLIRGGPDVNEVNPPALRDRVEAHLTQRGLGPRIRALLALAAATAGVSTFRDLGALEFLQRAGGVA